MPLYCCCKCTLYVLYRAGLGTQGGKKLAPHSTQGMFCDTSAPLLWASLTGPMWAPNPGTVCCRYCQSAWRLNTRPMYAVCGYQPAYLAKVVMPSAKASTWGWTYFILSSSLLTKPPMQ
eukprot:6854696-Ditylum_brightwellii.AAC.1